MLTIQHEARTNKCHLSCSRFVFLWVEKQDLYLGKMSLKKKYVTCLYGAWHCAYCSNPLFLSVKVRVSEWWLCNERLAKMLTATEIDCQQQKTYMVSHGYDAYFHQTPL